MVSFWRKTLLLGSRLRRQRWFALICSDGQSRRCQFGNWGDEGQDGKKGKAKWKLEVGGRRHHSHVLRLAASKWLDLFVVGAATKVRFPGIEHPHSQAFLSLEEKLPEAGKNTRRRADFHDF